MNARQNNLSITLWLSLTLAGMVLLLPGAGFESADALAQGCSAPQWDPQVQYTRGDIASYSFHEWKAKRNSLDVTPGTHKPTWQDLGACAGEPPPPPPPPPTGGSSDIDIFGVWHAGNHYADWAIPREIEEFDQANHWIIDRGDGIPSVNLVVLSFLHPMKVLNMTNDDVTDNGVPVGMTREIVDYFKDEGIRVMMSIGGVTYTDAWDEALATNATQLGVNAAAIATEFGVGIEIDYERNTDANLAGLQAFVDAYRSVHEYDATGTNEAARLTIDLAAGGRYLQELNHYATTYWLNNEDPVLDYANAMVARRSGTPDNWQEHVEGMPTYVPKIPPKAPNRFTGGLYLKGDMANCTDFYSSEQWQFADYVQTVAPAGAGTTNGMLGFMFWAAETPSARRSYVSTVPPNTCEGGMGIASTMFDVPIPMPALRQE
jgi:hypothetical protein